MLLLFSSHSFWTSSSLDVPAGASRALSLRNLVLGYECGRVFPAGVGLGSHSRDAVNWLPPRFSLSVETRRRYGWLRMMVFPGAHLFRAPIWCPSGGLLLLFLTFSVLVANPKKLLYTVANPARGLLNREKRTKEKVWQHTPPPTPHTARSEKINKITRRIYRRYAGGRSRVCTRIPSGRRLGLWVWLRNSTLPSAIIRFPVSLLLSSPGDV